MARMLNSVLLAALGAAGMYFMDPDRGRRRRAVVRDKLTSAGTRMSHSMDPIRRDAVNRMQGWSALWSSRSGPAAAPDETVVQRVRSTMGRYVSHPGAITVRVQQGRVTLEGDVLESEHGTMLRAIRPVPGVSEVQDWLNVHPRPDGVSALQGGRPRRGRRPELLQSNWAPATRAAVGAAGALLASYGLAGGRFMSATAGALMLIRSASNVPLVEALGIKGGGSIRVHKTITVNAAPETVFEALRDYDNFPQFMRNVRSVQVRPDGTSHWVVAGPGGAPVEWDAITTDVEENRLIAWASVEGSAVDHQGMIRLVPQGDERTQIHITMTYTPLAGALGHIVAVMSGADPKSELDEDMLRLKTFVETGRVPHDAAAAAPQPA